MKKTVWMDLQLFAEGEGAVSADTGAAQAAGGIAGETPATAAGIRGSLRTGDTLGNGQQVQNAQVAAELNRQMKRHPELRKVYGQRPTQPAQAEGQPGPAGTPERSIQERWEELKNGEMKELYGNDVRAAIEKRFKNQADATKQVSELQQQIAEQDALLKMAMKERGVNDLAGLRDSYDHDDSLVENEAAEAGMTVESYRTMKALQAENERLTREREQSIFERRMQNHYEGLVRQAEELKSIYPNFDLETELNDPKFMRLTSPEVGISVKDAFHLIHQDEIMGLTMKAGMERAQQQMSQTIRARGMRPVEGAAHGQGQPAAQAPLDFNNMTRPERNKFREQIKKGLVIPG